jgi:AcrR family transcriptional regulator
LTPLPNRRTSKSNLDERILSAAWDQIAREGAPALSLRAIARSLGIAAPSIYNYFSDRDALVTAMIVDAFISLAGAQETALNLTLAAVPPARLRALGMAYREWSVAHPQHYQLIFGTPIPFYQAPENITIPQATRALLPLMRVIQEIQTAGSLRAERLAPLSPKLEAMLDAWKEESGGTGREVLYLSLVIWSRLHGLVSLEIGNQLPHYLSDPSELFQRELDNILLQYL